MKGPAACCEKAILWRKKVLLFVLRRESADKFPKKCEERRERKHWLWSSRVIKMAQNATTKFTDNYELKEELGK